MKLDQATAIANDVMAKLNQHFTKSLICGSVRRQAENVNDIDIVAIPKPESQYQFGEESLDGAIIKLDPIGPNIDRILERFVLGDKIKRFMYNGIIIDLYIATPENYETLILIRTGSKEFNIRLTTSARRKGWKLFADGSGLWSLDHKEQKVMLIDNTEIGIIQKLLPAYVEPKGRTW